VRGWPRRSKPSTRASSWHEGLRPRLRPLGQRHRARRPARTLAGAALRRGGRGTALRRRRLAPRSRRRGPLPRTPWRALAALRRDAARARPARRRRRAVCLQAAADQLRGRAARATAATPAADPRHRRLGARLLLSRRLLGAGGAAAEPREPERAAVDVARRAVRGPRRRADGGLALPRRSLRRDPRAPRPRYRGVGAGALRPCRGPRPARRRRRARRDVPRHAARPQGRRGFGRGHGRNSTARGSSSSAPIPTAPPRGAGPRAGT